MIPATGGEARQITEVKGISGSPVWAPDSRWIATTVLLGPEGLERANGPGEQSPRDRFTAGVTTIRTLPYKLDGAGYLGDRYLQVAVAEVSAGEPLRILTAGPVHHSDPVWSPLGDAIAVAAVEWRVGKADPRHWSVASLRTIPVQGGTPRVLVESPGPVYMPSFAPDGGRIAYVGHHREFGDYTQPSLWVVSAAGGEPRNVSAGFDLPVGNFAVGDLVGLGRAGPCPCWSPDGRTLYCLASGFGMTHLVQVRVESGQVCPVTTGHRVIYHVSLSQDGDRAVLCHTDSVTPTDLFMLQLPSGVERRLTDVNRSFSASIELSVPERFTFGSGGVMVEGWVLRPPGETHRGPAPAVVQIHGGPMVMYGYPFFFEFQLLAAHGITVVYMNPRGCMGYGQAFAAAIRGQWGTLDFYDIMNGVDAVSQRGLVNPDRLGVAGGSYGGFMVNWIVGRTNRFQAAVSMRSISDRYSFFGTSDFGFTDVREYGGAPWQMARVYLQQSPIHDVEQVQTPLLLIHSAQDLRTPLGQAEEFYTALKVLGREAVLRIYPEESHGLSRSGQPWHRVDRLEAILGWFSDRLKPPRSA